MKFLCNELLLKLTQELSDVVCGTQVINGRIEAFSCKRTGSDKKTAHHLAKKFNSDVEIVPAERWKRRKFLSNTKSCQKDYNAGSYSLISPLGNFQHLATQRLLTDLILTLSVSFPDYDFASTKPDHFRHINMSSAIFQSNKKLYNLAAYKGPMFLPNLWTIIDESIVLSECEVFSYAPPDQIIDDMIVSSLTNGGEAMSSSSALWSLNYFFVNRNLKRILFFTCVQSHLTAPDYEDYLFEPNTESLSA